MTEKRFTLREPTIDGNIGCSEIADCGQWITYGEIVDLLNENQQLRQENKCIKTQLSVSSDYSVCTICEHHYYVEHEYLEGMYTSKCDLEHEKCSKDYVRFCKDFVHDGVIE